MSEVTLSNGLVKRLKKLPRSVIFRHTDALVAGIPDISLTWNGRTSWIETKYLNPKIIDRGIQRLNMRKLERAGTAFYVLWVERLEVLGGRATVIVPPRLLRESWSCCPYIPGFNHDFVVAFFKELHND